MIQIDPRNSTPICEQIVQNVKELCFKRVLKPGDQVSSVRELSKVIGVNPNSVSKAYQELENQGIIEEISGKGMFVTERARSLIYEEKMRIVLGQLKQMIVTARYKGMDMEQMQNWLSNGQIEEEK
ncbi:GntR family transcriptional regulator [Bacillus sp. FJAT-47783]|uniref:GntR family transcriptional regulator n=1 Tax=Bacillus sp. FJAT-47783 TaxID=2922712 RepID=UPI001FABBC02|nr:GntR family transcriptional regulator [Bacillus sp. FJAT-47783]